jgi:hypothetical protein
VSTVQTEFLRTRAEYYSSKISEKCENSTQHRAGFVDGTLIEIAKSCGMLQRATYSGHKRRPGLKWQVITTLDGIVVQKQQKPPYSSLSILVIVLVHLIVQSETALVA